jgi:hypothetical protein
MTEGRQLPVEDGDDARLAGMEHHIVEAEIAVANDRLIAALETTRYMCGFTQSKRATVPSMTISLLVSNIDWLWCAEAGAESRAVAVRIDVAAVSRFMA